MVTQVTLALEVPFASNAEVVVGALLVVGVEASFVLENLLHASYQSQEPPLSHPVINGKY
jgi:hypothetical protein